MAPVVWAGADAVAQNDTSTAAIATRHACDVLAFMRVPLLSKRVVFLSAHAQ